MTMWVRALASVVVCAGAQLACGGSRLNEGAWDWLNAAKTGRAGVFFMGDSIVNHGQGGWTAGLALAAQNSIGLAGSSLLTAPTTAPAAWSNYAGARLWTNSTSSSTQTGIPSLSPFGRYLSVPADLAFLGAGVDSVRLDLSGRVDWHVLATATSPQARLGAARFRRVGSSNYELQTIPTQSLSGADGTSEQVFRFDAPTSAGEWQSFAFTPDSRDLAMHYTRLTLPDRTGISVSGWGFAGGTCDAFRDQYYNASTFTPSARDAMYRSLVAGDSGKLNLVISFGVNDARTYTPEAYGTEVVGLIADVRRDWNHAGLNPGDLSFTLLSPYQIDSSAVASATWYRLASYAGVLDAIASVDSQISYIDMWNDGPTWQTAVASGYLSDGIHPTALGTQVYGDLLMRLLDPRAGDTDVNGKVDFNDLLMLTQHYGQTQNATWQQGDFNANGAVDFNDLLALLQNYTPTGANASADVALARQLVPEPAALLIGVSALSFRRIRRA